MVEAWLPIDKEGDYLASNTGYIASAKDGEKFLLRPNIHKTGYASVMVGGRRRINIHRIIATLFVPNPDNKPTVNHKDGDKSNNKASNLEWMTHGENQKHAYRLGLKQKSGGGKDREIIRHWANDDGRVFVGSAAELCREYPDDHLKRGTLSKVALEKYVDKSHKGWRITCSEAEEREG